MTLHNIGDETLNSGGTHMQPTCQSTMQRLLTLTLRLSAVFLIASGISWAQHDTATVAGTVTDSSGAVLPAANVTVTNADTKLVFKGVSNQAGLYSIPNLPIGDYTLDLTHEGFKTFSAPGLHLVAAQVLEVNAKLSVGSVSETVHVTGIPQLLDTENSMVAVTVESKDINTIPMSVNGGRDASNIQYAITPTMMGYWYQDDIAGSQQFSKSVLIDGIDATSAMQGVVLTQGQDSISEMQVQIAGVNIDHAATGGGAVLYETKSGTNSLHGSAFYYTQNEDLNANDWADNYFLAQCSSSSDVPACRSQYGRARDRFNDYGGSMGGPIWKNHTFIFGAWERYSQTNNILTPASATVPTTTMLGGDFSALLTQGTYQGVINDPTTQQPIINPCTRQPYLYGQIFDPATWTSVNGIPCGTPFPGNIIPTSRFGTLSKGIISLYQKYYVPTLPTITNNFSTNNGGPAIKDNFDLRADDKLTARQSLMFGFTYVTLFNAGSCAGCGLGYYTGGPLSSGGQSTLHEHIYRARHTFAITPNLVNTLSGSYVYLFTDESSWPHENPVAYGFPNSDSNNFPILNFGGGNGIGETSTSQVTEDHYHYAVFHYQDAVSWLKGKHTFKFGGEFSAMQNNNGFGGPQIYNFANNTGGPIDSRVAPFIGSGFAAMMLGDVTSASIQEPDPSYSRRKNYDLFVDDSWKASQRLTVELGLRWDANTPFHDALGQWQQFNPHLTNPSGAWGSYPGAWQFTTNSSQSFETTNDLWQFSPHLGAAYRLKNNFVARGGYGITYVPLNINTQWGLSPYEDNQFWIANNQVNNFVSGSTAYDWNNGYPGQPLYYSRTSSQTYLPTGNGSPWYVDPTTLRLGMVQNFNGGIEWEAAKNILLSANYVGNKGSRLHDGALETPLNYPSWATYSAILEAGQVNAVVTSPGQAAAAGVPYPYSGFSGYAWSAISPYPQLASTVGPIQYGGSPLGVSEFNAFIVEAKAHNAHGLSMDMSYTLSKATGSVQATNNIGGCCGNYGFQNIQEYSEAKHWAVGIDQKNVAKGYVNYDLPFGTGKRWAFSSRLLNQAIGGWTIGILCTYQTGSPILGPSAANYETPGWMGPIRSNVAPGFHYGKNPRGRLDLNNLADPSNTAFDASAFTDPPTGQFGNVPYIVQGWGPNYNDTDISIAKALRFGQDGRYAFTLRAEFFDALNQHHYNAPDTGRDDQFFGQVTGVYGNRVGQLSGRFTF